MRNSFNSHIVGSHVKQAVDISQIFSTLRKPIDLQRSTGLWALATGSDRLSLAQAPTYQPGLKGGVERLEISI
jgi:hypothetical protein